MPCSLVVAGILSCILRCVSAADSSSLDESTTVGFGALLELDFAGVALVGVPVSGREASAPIFAIGGVFAAGEKLIFVWRLRSRAFVRAIFTVVLVKGTSFVELWAHQGEIDRK
jgi:hypothetical protein